MHVAENGQNQQCWISDPHKLSAGPTEFRVDFCFDSSNPEDPGFVTQKSVFDALGIDILAKAWCGFHACLFAYGQTGSGKTYSVMGSAGKDEMGVLPRLCEALFYFISRTEKTEDFKVDATMLEIYNEEIFDLLNVRPPKDVEIPILKPRERILMERKMNKLRKAGKNSEADAIRVKLDPEFAAKMTLKDLPKIREDPSLGVIVENLKHFAVARQKNMHIYTVKFNF